MSQSSTHCDCSGTPSECRNHSELETLRAKVAELEDQIAELTALVRTDGLTGLYNHRYFREALHRELERTQRTGVDFCLMLLDLDHFKNVNDTYGHEIGNLALQHTATLIKESLRPMDLPCRYGGEEFAILLPSTPLLTSRQVAERIRTTIENTPINTGEHTLQLTASLGIAAYNKNSILTEEQLIETADQQLYRAKQTGRNRVCYAAIASSEKQNVSQEEKDLLFDVFNSSPQ